MAGPRPAGGRSSAGQPRPGHTESAEDDGAWSGYRGAGHHAAAAGARRYKDAGARRYQDAGARHRAPKHSGQGRTGRRRDPTGGAEGNERLTALVGGSLLLLFAAEGVTIAALRQLLTLHFFIGTLLVGPVLLKIGSTGYRFVRYYTGGEEYRRKGPPAPLLRLLGPFVILLSVGVIGSGIMLALVGPSSGLWNFVHKATFVLWFGAMTIHVLAYVWRLPRLVRADAVIASRRALSGRAARWLLVTASLLTGLVLAVLIYQRAAAWHGFVGG